MLKSSLHPNTSAMLQAWRRMLSMPDDIDGGPTADDYPELLERLFILDMARPDTASFRVAGENLPPLLGRNLIGTNFLDLWTATDRLLVDALLQSVLSEDGPGLLRGFGETSEQRRVEVEIAIAPLTKSKLAPRRVLCLYQTLGGEAMLNKRAIWSHRLRSVYPPEPPRIGSNLRLVADNT